MKQKKSLSFPGILFFVMLFAGAMLREFDNSVIGTVIIVSGVIAFIALSLLQTVKTTQKSPGQKSAPGRTGISRESEDPRMKSFTKPDAPCIVCEHTGEDHLMRDKINRIRQLDDWLKSGLIDRSEYHVLKDRYERDL